MSRDARFAPKTTPPLRWRFVLLCVLACSAGIACATALGAHTKSAPSRLLGISIPASARIHGTTTSPSTSTPASSAPASATTTPAGAAQPGTVAPSATPTAPATTLPSTTTPAQTPTASSPTGAKATQPAGGREKHRAHGTHVSTLAIVLAALGALLLLCCVAWGLVRWLALEPRWSTSLAYSLRETLYRGSCTWAELLDWARLGR